MEEQKKLEHAKAVFNTLCKALDSHKWHYAKDEETLSVECGAQGDDLPMEFTVRVDVDRMLVLLISRMPFAVQEDKRIDLAIAVNAINNVLADGCFDYDVSSGRMFFRMTNSFIESSISEEVFSYMLFSACAIVDKYNDKFLMLAKGMISIQQFISTLAD